MGKPLLEIRAIASQKGLIHTDWVTLSVYPSRGYRYYRLQWGTGQVVLGCCHIPGGNLTRTTAQLRARQVAAWIRDHLSRDEILRRISDWKKATSLTSSPTNLNGMVGDSLLSQTDKAAGLFGVDQQLHLDLISCYRDKS